MNLSLKDMKGEKWKDIPSFDGYFMVSNYGRLWALPRPIHLSTGQKYFTKEHIKKQNVTKYYNKYSKDHTYQLSVHIRYERMSYNFKVNRLVYDLFVRRLKNFKDDRLVVAHKDGDNLNNNCNNLVLVNGTEFYSMGLQSNRRQPLGRRKAKHKQPMSRPVVKYTLMGTKVATYESLALASKANKVHRQSIRNVANKKLKQLKGFVYRFQGDKYAGEYRNFTKKKPVTQYDLQGKKIALYESIKIASKKTGIDAAQIGKSALKKAPTAGGYVWRYLNDKYRGEHKTGKHIARPVIQYTLEGRKVFKYASANQAALQTGFSPTVILDCLAKRSKVSHGFVWRFANEPYKGEYKNYRIGKPVTQFTLQGKKIRTYPTIQNAALNSGLTAANIQKNFIGQNRTAGGFIWRPATPKEIHGIGPQKAANYSRLAKTKIDRNIIQYTLDGKKVGQYSSVTEAANACRISSPNIYSVLNKLNSSAGYVWRTQGHPYRGDLAKHPFPSKAIIVTQYDLKGKRINTFKSTKEAERSTGISSSSISAVARGKLKTTGGFIWRYNDESSKLNVESYFKSTFEKIKKISKPVVKYSLKGKREAEYDSISAAAREEGISVSRISSVVNGDTFSAGGYFWKLK
jgi:hypothetical protein